MMRPEATALPCGNAAEGSPRRSASVARHGTPSRGPAQAASDVVLRTILRVLLEHILAVNGE